MSFEEGNSPLTENQVFAIIDTLMSSKGYPPRSVEVNLIEFYRAINQILGLSESWARNKLSILRDSQGRLMIDVSAITKSFIISRLLPEYNSLDELVSDYPGIINNDFWLSHFSEFFYELAKVHDIKLNENGDIISGPRFNIDSSSQVTDEP
jgi:hypothetical protein